EHVVGVVDRLAHLAVGALALALGLRRGGRLVDPLALVHLLLRAALRLLDRKQPERDDEDGAGEGRRPAQQCLAAAHEGLRTDAARRVARRWLRNGASASTVASWPRRMSSGQRR